MRRLVAAAALVAALALSACDASAKVCAQQPNPDKRAVCENAK